MNGFTESSTSLYNKRRRLSPLDIIRILFGGVGVQSGSVFFWCFLLFTIFLNSATKFNYIFENQGRWMDTEGVVTQIGHTDYRNGRRNYTLYDYKYVVDGQTYEGFSKGRGFSISENEKVDIEYMSKNPRRSHISGMSDNQEVILYVFFMLAMTLLVAFPYFGGLRRNLRWLKVIRRGKATVGIQTSQKKSVITFETSKRQWHMYDIDFEFEVAGKKYKATARTAYPEQVEDEPKELILYLPEDPTVNLVYDSIGFKKKKDKNGQIVRGRVKGSALIRPLSTIVGLGLTIGFIYLLYTSSN
jgi:hypothetical protein